MEKHAGKQRRLANGGELGHGARPAHDVRASVRSVPAILLGKNGKRGNVRKEKLVVTPRQIERWAARFELDLFTGRTRQEFSYTFERWPGTRFFRTIVTMDDVKRKKPHPDGLLKILGKRDSSTALYVGDNIDDALAARDARVPFMAILPPGTFEYRKRAARFRELNALALLPRIAALNEWLPPR